MAQIMKADPWQLRCAQEGPERAAAEVSRFYWPANLIGKNQVLIIPGRAQSEPLGRLPTAVLVEGVHRAAGRRRAPPKECTPNAPTSSPCCCCTRLMPRAYTPQRRWACPSDGCWRPSCGVVTGVLRPAPTAPLLASPGIRARPAASPAM